MKLKAVLAVAAVLSLGACAAPDYDDNDAPRHEHRHDHGDRNYDDRGQSSDRRSPQSFECENGLSVTVRNLDTNRVELSLDDKRAVLSSAVSGSGERYVSNRGLFGKGAEWHQKGSQAFFSFVDPYGIKVDTSCNQR